MINGDNDDEAHDGYKDSRNSEIPKTDGCRMLNVFEVICVWTLFKICFQSVPEF